MKAPKLFLLALALCANGCVINPSFSKLSEKEKVRLMPLSSPNEFPSANRPYAVSMEAKASTDSIKVYKANAESVYNQMAKSNNLLTHIYIYSTFCKPCITELPKIMQMHKLNQSMNFFMITPENWSALDNVKYFLRSNNVGFPTYVLDIDRYGDEHSVVKRYQGFVGEIYPGHPEMLGLPTHIIINKQRKVLFAATGANKFSAAVLDSVMRANR